MNDEKRSKSAYMGCLLGGAIGDALGAPIEFLRLSEIRKTFGPKGVRDYAQAYGRIGAITDDTQMTLFTAEALIRAHNRWNARGICSVEDVAHHAYLRWLHTQGEPYHEMMMKRGWLVEQKELYHRRAPGNSCLSALHASKYSSADKGTLEHPINSSKGCGGVMRMAPVGLVRDLNPFETGVNFAAITHGHPTGYLSAGFFAQLIFDLSFGTKLKDALQSGLSQLESADAEETRQAIEAAINLAEHSAGSADDVETLGAGWVAEEALAIGVYCALQAKDFAHGVLMAVNHSGDSDSTGSIAGNILGLVYGVEEIPNYWLESLELKDIIIEVANDLWLHFGEENNDVQDEERYPGS